MSYIAQSADLGVTTILDRVPRWNFRALDSSPAGYSPPNLRRKTQLKIARPDRKVSEFFLLEETIMESQCARDSEPRPPKSHILEGLPQYIDFACIYDGAHRCSPCFGIWCALVLAACEQSLDNFLFSQERLKM
jgi:hypothetical protein